MKLRLEASYGTVTRGIKLKWVLKSARANAVKRHEIMYGAKSEQCTIGKKMTVIYCWKRVMAHLFSMEICY